MSGNDEHERAIEFARAALARARAHARTTTRPGWQSSRARGGSRRWGAEPGEAVYSGAAVDRRDPAKLGAALSELISMQGWGEALTVAGVTARWVEIVGPDVAEHVSVEAFEVGSSGSGPAGATHVSHGSTAAEPVEVDDDTAIAADTAGLNPGEHAGVMAQSLTSSGRSVNSARIVVRADSTAWATQIRMLLPALRRRIADDLAVLASQAGYSASAEWQVDVTVLAPSAPSWRKGARHISGRGPRDTYG